jgi:hypothetical protein
LKTVTRNRFYQDNQLHQELAEHQIKLEHTIADQIDVVQLFEKIRSHTQSVVLVIDEFEGIPDAVLSEMMHAFRQMYHRKKYHARNELILVGVRKLLRDK